MEPHSTAMCNVATFLVLPLATHFEPLLLRVAHNYCKDMQSACVCMSESIASKNHGSK